MLFYGNALTELPVSPETKSLLSEEQYCTPSCFFLPTSAPISLTVTVMRKVLLRFN